MPPVVSTSTIACSADRVAVLVNPKAGVRDSRSRADRLVQLLQERGFAVEVFTNLGDVATLANRWHDERRLRALVGVGGDGTAAELINRTGQGVPLCFLPAGNSNLLARYFRLSGDPATLARTITDGTAARLDAGEANGRIFSLMAGIGFDAEVVRRVHERRTGHINLGSYGWPIFETIRHYEYPRLRVDWEDEGGGLHSWRAGDGRTAPVRWLFAFNLPCYGGGLRIAPGADGSDNLLDACAFRHGRWQAVLRYATAVFARQHHRLSDCTVRRVRRLCVAADAKVPYQLDGDPGGFLPLDVRSLPGRLTLIVPADAAAVARR